MELQSKVAQAVQVLNHDPQSCNRVAANQWLVQFQQTDAAWEVATSILTSDLHRLNQHCQSVSYFELEFFAAQVLKRKIQSEWNFLQLEARDALLNALLVAANRFSLGPHQLLTQICLALSALILRSVEHRKPIERLFYSLENLRSQGNGYFAVLEMLTVLPEEAFDDQSTDYNISSTCRYQYSQELLLHTPMVLEFLLQQFEKCKSGSQLHDTNRKILRCLLSWVRAGCFSEAVLGFLPTHPLLNFVFNCLEVSLSFDLAIEVLVELVSRHEGLPKVILCRIQYLKEVLLIPALSDGEEKVISGLACLMSEIGQAAPALVVEASNEALALTDALLSCLSFPSEDWGIADSTLPFWCSVGNYILGPDLESATGETVKEIFCSMYSALLDAILLRAQVDDSTYNDESGTGDLPDSLANFRSNLLELLVDICQLLSSTIFIQKLLSGVRISANAPIPWKEVEAKMFVLNVVVEGVSLECQTFDISVVLQFVTILSTKGPAELKGFMCIIYRAVANVVGSYSKWISASNTDFRPLL